MVLLRRDSPGDKRMPSIRADYDPRLRHDRSTASIATMDPDNPAIGRKHGIGAETFADFGSRLPCCVDEQLVEDSSPGAVRDRSAVEGW